MSGIILASVGNSYGALPINTDAPAVSGTAEIGNTLSSTTGTWTGAPAPTFTYQWQRGSTNISGATSSSYTVVTGDAPYTLRCNVTAANSVGAVSAYTANTSSVPEPAPTTIGQAYGGGYYAGKIGVSGVATHYLVVGPLASAEDSSEKWKNANTATTGADSVIDGPQNTADMVSDGNSTVYPSAHFCNDLTIGGYSDWYMPAENELEICYYNLKPEIYDNHTSSGANTNAVPSRSSNYTTGTPARTSATVFRYGNAQAFASDNYWTSTEYGTTSALTQNFWYGRQDYGSKVNGPRVRAIRRVAV